MSVEQQVRERCRAIQNYGEQHPEFHSEEMKEYRRAEAKREHKRQVDAVAYIAKATDNRPVAFLELLEQRAKEICPDYPYGGATAFDWLWAITSSYTGTNAANQDCHAFIKHLAGKLGISDQDLYQEWQTFKAKVGQ